MMQTPRMEPRKRRLPIVLITLGDDEVLVAADCWFEGSPPMSAQPSTCMTVKRTSAAPPYE
jgi:hypothetical protein